MVANDPVGLFFSFAAVFLVAFGSRRHFDTRNDWALVRAAAGKPTEAPSQRCTTRTVIYRNGGMR